LRTGPNPGVGEAVQGHAPVIKSLR
jgi:hypothetical protein